MKIPFQPAPMREYPGGDPSIVPPGGDISTATLPDRASLEMAKQGQAATAETNKVLMLMAENEERDATLKAYSEAAPKLLQTFNDWKSKTTIGSESRYKKDYESAPEEGAVMESLDPGERTVSALDALKSWQKTYADAVKEHLDGIPDDRVRKRLESQFLRDGTAFDGQVVGYIKQSQDMDTKTALTGITNTLANKVMTTPGYTIDMMMSDTKAAFDGARLEPALKTEMQQKATFVQMHTVLSGWLADPRRASEALEFWETRKATLEKNMSSADFASVTKLMETQGKIAKVDKLAAELYEDFEVFKGGELDKEGALALQKALADPQMRKDMNVDLDTAQKVQDRLTHDMLQIEHTKALVQKEDEDKKLEELYTMMATNKRGALRQIQLMAKDENGSAEFKHKLVIAQNTIESYFATQESRAYTREARLQLQEQKKIKEENRIKTLNFETKVREGAPVTDSDIAAFVAGTGGTRNDYDAFARLRDAIKNEWAKTPNGKVVAAQLIEYKKNNIFDKDDVKNNALFNTEQEYWRGYLKNNPNATATQINSEMAARISPYKRGRIMKTLDAIQGALK